MSVHGVKQVSLLYLLLVKVSMVDWGKGGKNVKRLSEYFKNAQIFQFYFLLETLTTIKNNIFKLHAQTEQTEFKHKKICTFSSSFFDFFNNLAPILGHFLFVF